MKKGENILTFFFYLIGWVALPSAAFKSRHVFTILRDMWSIRLTSLRCRLTSGDAIAILTISRTASRSLSWASNFSQPDTTISAIELSTIILTNIVYTV